MATETVLTTTCSPFVETPEESEDRKNRIATRRNLSKFGDVNKTAGSERGITQKVQTGVALIWKGEEPSAASPSKKISSKPKKKYKPPSSRAGKYAPPPEDEKVVLTSVAKTKKLIAYCEDKMPPEPAPSSGGKKRKKRKKQKLQHPIEYVSMFMELGITPPKTTKDLPKKLEALNALIVAEEN